MKFIIEHLSKQFDKKEVLRDIDFTFESRKNIWTSGTERRREDNFI